MTKLAILSPQVNAYSETFIQAHRSLPFNIYFYNNGLVPTQLNGETLVKNKALKLYNRVKAFVFKRYNAQELALKQSLKREKIDVVLAEYATTASESINVIKDLKIPLIVHFHGFDASIYSVVSDYKDRYKILFSYAKYIIVVSQRMHKDLLGMGCPKEKLILNTYGPNPVFLTLHPNFSKKQFVATGRFVDKKAPYATIMAFKKAHNKHTDTNLVMIGDGPLLNTCQNLARLLDIEDAVSFPGVLKPEDIRELFENSLAFVQHSIVANDGDSEGTPLSILEAQAAGLPVISTSHAGIPDVVIHNETGLLSNELDIEEMGNHIKYLIENPEIAERLGKNGKKRIVNHFNLKNHLQVIESLIKKS